jgi:hypothetical protein
MPIDLPEPPYAYVVDVRPFDAGCVVPNCSIRGRSVSGYTNAVELDGDLGAYVMHGKPDNESFFRRARILRRGESFAFDVPESNAASELDFYLSNEGSGPWRARVRIASQRKSAPAEAALERSFEGTTAVYKPRTKDEELGRLADFEQHVRLPLPSRQDRMLHVVIENTGEAPLALGSPLVMKRVDGRGPRQGFVVVFDAVPFYLMDRFFTGTGDEPTEFFHKATSERGIYFPQGYSPAVCTQVFVRRFFRNGYFKTEGEPILRGFDLDEEPPARSSTTIARLAEQGFLTEQFVGNFMLNPHASSTAVDGGYQNEMISGEWPSLYHPHAIASRFDAWLAEHAHDDTWAVVWMSTTHDALPLKIWSATRPKVPTPQPPDVTSPAEYRAKEVDARWENLLDSGDAVRAIFQSAARRSPSASRLWFIGTDHGLIEATANGNRPSRYKGAIVGGGPIHRFFGSTEESWTPFGLLYDGVARPPGGPRVIKDRTMAAASWRAVEQLFDVDLGLPETTSWDSPGLSRDLFASRWVDDGAFSLGNGGALRVASAQWGYRLHDPNLTLAALWEQPANFQLMLGGTERRSGRFTSEELYDDALDPLERRNVAGEHEGIVLAMRRRAEDFAATYYDPPSHSRHRYVLTFDRALDVVLEAPNAFKLKVDGTDVVMASPRRAVVRGRQLEILEDQEPVGIVSVKGAGVTGPLLLRCASSGQPLDELGPERDRFDLALGRHNCVLPIARDREGEVAPPRGEVWFSAELVRSKSSGTTSESGTNADTLQALRRWGYVRDIDAKH